MKKVVAVLLILVMLFSLAGCFGDSDGGLFKGKEEKKDFNELYPGCANEWWTIASDGSYMKIDTNPYDTDKDDFDWSYYETYFTPANDKIEELNKELGFAESLSEKMNNTTWSQGVQTDSNDEYVVTWTYHPDKGLEVMYEFNNDKD